MLGREGELLHRKEIISTNQFVWMIFSIITSFSTLQVLGLLIFHAGRDAWISAIIAWFLDVMLAIIYVYMGLRFPNQNMIQYSITILGKYFGKIVGLIFTLFFLLVSSLLMRAMSGLLANLILPNTPISVIIFCGYILIAYAVTRGIEVIARACEVLGPIYLISLVILLIFVSPLVKINRLKPQFIDGFYPSLSGSMFILPYIGICFIMGMYIPICNRPQNGFLAKFIAVSLGVTIISTLVSFGIGVFGVHEAGNMINIGFELMKVIELGNSIGHVEIIWLMIAIAAGIMTVANLIWASSIGISQVIGLNTYKNIIYPCTLISCILSIISFNSSIEILNFTLYVYPFIGLFVETGLEVFLFIMALVLKKKGNIKSKI